MLAGTGTTIINFTNIDDDDLPSNSCCTHPLIFSFSPGLQQLHSSVIISSGCHPELMISFQLLFLCS
jgi:hypothetical protein